MKKWNRVKVIILLLNIAEIHWILLRIYKDDNDKVDILVCDPYGHDLYTGIKEEILLCLKEHLG